MCAISSAIDMGDIERTSDKRLGMSGDCPAGAGFAGVASRGSFSKFSSGRRGLKLSLHAGEK